MRLSAVWVLPVPGVEIIYVLTFSSPSLSLTVHSVCSYCFTWTFNNLHGDGVALFACSAIAPAPQCSSQGCVCAFHGKYPCWSSGIHGFTKANQCAQVENAASWIHTDWQDEFRIAQVAHIDAFAMNIRMGDPKAEQSLDYAFVAAQNTGFKLFLSFDYAGGGAWPATRSFPTSTTSVRTRNTTGTMGSRSSQRLRAPKTLWTGSPSRRQPTASLCRIGLPWGPKTRCVLPLACPMVFLAGLAGRGEILT